MFGLGRIIRSFNHDTIQDVAVSYDIETSSSGRTMNQRNWLRAVGCLSAFLSGTASAASISLQGALALSAGAANATAAYSFFVSAASTVIIQSYGYGGSSSSPGGTNLAGTLIPAGGFDPYISLFTGAGPSATFLASNDDGACPPGTQSGGLCGDSTLSLSLGPGTYTLVVEAFDNMSLAENLGSGTLGDGFTGLGNYDPVRTNNFAIDVSGPFVDTIFANGFE
jgi:hypothetical protein